MSCKGHFFDDTSLLFLTVPQGTLFRKTPRFIKKLTLFAFKPGLQTCSKGSCPDTYPNQLMEFILKQTARAFHYTPTGRLAFTISLFRSGPVEIMVMGTSSAFSKARR